MRHAIRNLAATRDRGQHPGLMLERYLSDPQPGKDGDAKERQALLDAVVKSAHEDPVRELYAAAFTRWEASLPPTTKVETLTTPPFARLIVGLGQESVLEAGLRLHHTYGVPVIPGSGLKGLASHYCHAVWGQVHDDKADDENRRYRRGEAYHDLLFGYTRGPDAADAGAVVFHDAWITPASLAGEHTGVLRDVMTPHHPKWQDGTQPPTDFDSPNPLSFLSVAGAFRVAVSWNGPADHDHRENWTELAHALLEEALWEWGVGGKTSSGYGRLGTAARLAEAAAQPAGGPADPTGGSRAKRGTGSKASVKILGKRPKGGYDVQEAGYPAGTLTLGTPATPPDDGAVVAVEVHNDDPAKPQYRWPPPAPAAAGKRPTPPGRSTR